MKRNLIIALACSVMAVACHNEQKNSNTGGFTINGIVRGMDSGWIYFSHYDSARDFKDSVRIKQQQFTYTGKVSAPSQFFMWVRTSKGMQQIDLFVEDTLINMQVNKDTMINTVITGSPVEDQFIEYKKALKPIMDKTMQLYGAYDDARSAGNKPAMDSIEKLMDNVDKEKQDMVKGFVEKNPSSIIGAWAVSTTFLYEPDLKLLEEFYGKFSPSVQQCKYAKTIKKEIDVEEKLQPGMVAPEFTQNDTTGKPVALSSFRGKYLLVDFWASWCHPCRNENPNVVAAYKKYKDKNFTILSVSFDKNKANWEKAINDDGLMWTQVCDLKAWENEAGQLYGIKAIPSNYLLGPDGKILAHNLRGEELVKKLAEVLK